MDGRPVVDSVDISEKPWWERINSLLVIGFSSWVRFSHLRLIDLLFDNLPIATIAAFCWGLVQAVLTYYFFPEILQFLMVTMGLHVAIPTAILYVAVVATFTTLFKIGQSVNTTRVCKKIHEALSSSKSMWKTLSVFLILVITHFLAFGYVLEWFAKASCLLPIPIWGSWIICSLAIMNLLLFSVERCMNTLNVAFAEKSHGSELSRVNMAVKIGMNVSMHLVLFTLLGILPIGYIYALFSLGFFASLYAINHYDWQKSLWQNIDDIIYDWVFLITHASAEGGVAAAGICLWLQHFITNASLLHAMVVFTLIASTVCEELEDMVHEQTDKDEVVPLTHNYVPDDNKKIHRALQQSGMKESAINSYLGESVLLDNQEATNHKQLLVEKLPLAELVRLVKQGHVPDLSYLDIYNAGKTEGECLQAGMPIEVFAHQQNSYAPYIDKWLRIDMLLLFFTLLTGFTPITIGLIAGINGYYLYHVTRCFIAKGYPAKKCAQEFLEIGYNRLYGLILFYACMTTALCLGINGGLEFLHMCGTNIAMVFFIAIAGAIIESSVFFDQIKSGDGAGDDQNNKLPMMAFIFNMENMLATTGVLSMAAAFGSLLTITHLASVGAALCIGIGLVVVYGDNLFSVFKYALCEGDAAIFSLASITIGMTLVALCTLSVGSMGLLISLLPVYTAIACASSMLLVPWVQSQLAITTAVDRTYHVQPARELEVSVGKLAEMRDKYGACNGLEIKPI